MNHVNINLIIFIFSIILLMIVIRNPAPKKEYKVNEFLSLKLENGITNIYVKNRQFRQCMYLLLNIPTDRIRDYEEIDSIDKAAEHLDRSMEGNRSGQYGIDPEVEFWGHCSNITAWAENGYDTRILHRNLAFPLLKRLVEVGDPQARKVFKEEIALRLSSNHPTVINYLIQENYLRHLSSQELESIFDDINLSFLDNLVKNLNHALESPQPISDKHILYLFQNLFRRFDQKHIPLIFSKIKKRITHQHHKKMALLIYEKYKNKSSFPDIKFINNNIDAFDLDEFSLVEYDSKIIGILEEENTQIFLNDKNIEFIYNIEGFEAIYESIEELNLNNNIIETLEGIGKFPNLKILNLDNNMISNLSDLENLSNLEDLSIRNNRITDLENLDGLESLKRINLSGNKLLKEIPQSLNQLPQLKSVKVWNCDIRIYNENTKEFFWNDQNYRYFTGFTEEALQYYEKTHKANARSREDGGLYKDFTRWVIKMNTLIRENKISYGDIKKFEELTESNAIWSGKLTRKFEKWLFNKSQMKITEFF